MATRRPIATPRNQQYAMLTRDRWCQQQDVTTGLEAPSPRSHPSTWVQRFTPLLIDAARPYRHAAGDRWFVDETYVKVNGVWRYVYRAVDQHGQVIDVYVSQRRDIASARTFFTLALSVHDVLAEVVTD